MATIAFFFPLFHPRSPVSVPSAGDHSRPKWLQNVLRPLHQQSSHLGIAFLTDVHLGLALAGVSPSWLQSLITTHVAALAKTMWGLPA